MSLQARLRHTLGERWIELPEQGVDQPIVVGRAATCDVQVPSVTVGQRHCVLFVHEGQWVVQDVGAGATPGTYVNGVKIEAAAFLNVGDVITLGHDAAAPSLDIDPATAAQGRAGQPAAATGPVAAAAEAPASFDAPQAVVPQYPVPQYAAPQYAAPPPAGTPLYAPPYAPAYPPGYVASPPAHVPVSAPGDAAMVDWPADATPRYYTPRRRKASDGSNGVILGMVLTLLITAGAGYWIYRTHEQQQAVVVPPPAAATLPSRGTAVSRADEEAAHAPPNIFDNGGGNSTTRPRGTKSPTTAVASAVMPDARMSAPVPSQPTTARAVPAESPDMSDSTAAPPTPGDASADPAAAAVATADDPAWKQVEAAQYLKDHAKAILQFDDYARTHPGVATDKLAAFTDKHLDRLWFERLENLAEQRDALNKKVAEVDQDMAEETDPAYKARVLVPLKQQYASRIQNIEEELRQNMKYEAKDPPNLLDDDAVEKLRRGRDPQYYASWKERILTHIRRTHGELPWVGAGH